MLLGIPILGYVCEKRKNVLIVTCVAVICIGSFQADSHALLVAERGLEYHKLSYQGKIDYWQEVTIKGLHYDLRS